MSFLCQKYGITPEAYNKMVKDGIISTTYGGHEEIFLYFKECLTKNGGKKPDAVQQVCVDRGISQSTVYNIIAEFR